MLSALSYFQLAVEFAALPQHVFTYRLHAITRVLLFRRLPLHVFAPVLLAHVLLKVATQDV